MIISDFIVKSSRKLFLPLLLIFLFLSAFLVKNNALEYQNKLDIPEEILRPPNKVTIKLASAGFSEAVADYYWLKVIQHFGGRKVPTDEIIQKLYPLLDLITHLAPSFEYAYRFGQTALTVRDTNEDLAIKLLNKGLINRPDIWQIPYYLGFDYWYFKNNPGGSAMYYHDAARLAPPYMKWLDTLSARMYSEAYNPDVAITILKNMLDLMETDLPSEREHKENLLKLAYMEKDILILEDKVKTYKELYAKLPQNLDALVSSGLLKSIPEEPHGGKYVLKEDGSIASTGTSERFKPHKVAPSRY